MSTMNSLIWFQLGLQKLFTKHKTVFEISKVKELRKYFTMKHGYFTIFLKNSLKYENEEIVVVATFKMLVATCGEWRQCWTTLL